jgi:hypothetical protein
MEILWAEMPRGGDLTNLAYAVSSKGRRARMGSVPERSAGSEDESLLQSLATGCRYYQS